MLGGNDDIGEAKCCGLMNPHLTVHYILRKQPYACCDCDYYVIRSTASDGFNSFGISSDISASAFSIWMN